MSNPGTVVPNTALRPSRVLARLRAGQVVSCIKMNLADARVAEIAARSGIDCIWQDREHCPNDLAGIEHQIRAAKLYDVDTVVRVPRGSYSDLIWPLEMDAAGIMVPHCMSAADARQIAWQTRFHPIGRRPLDGGNMDGGFCTVPLRTYMEHANRERFVIVQIEDPEAFEELDAICATPGIDMIFYGPGDYAHAIGHAGEMDHPQVIAARHRVAECARRHGKFAGTVGSPASLATLVQTGYRFISVGADVLGLADYFRTVVSAFGHESTPQTQGPYATGDACANRGVSLDH